MSLSKKDFIALADTIKVLADSFDVQTINEVITPEGLGA